VGCLAAVVFPVVDLALLWMIGRRIGLGPTAGMLAVTAVIGVVLAHAQGTRALREVQQALGQRRSPEIAVISTFLVFVGGVLLAFPGPVSDVAGVLLLFPPSRAAVARLLRRRWERAVASGNVRIEASGVGVRWQWRSDAGGPALPLDPEYDPDSVNDRAAAMVRRGESAQAIELWERALEAYARAGTPIGRGVVLIEMAGVLATRSDVPRALAALDEALTIFSGAAIPDATAVVLYNRGNIVSNTGDEETAIACWRRAAEIQLQLGDDRGRATTLTNMGNGFVRLRRPGEAMPIYQQALALFEKVGDEDGKVRVLQCLSLLSDGGNN